MSERNGDDKFIPDMFDLDASQLDKEWLTQAALVYQSGVRKANAREALERAKAARDVAKADLEKANAQLDRRIRSDPASFGLDAEKRPTEAQVSNLILLQDEHEAAQTAVWRAEEKIAKRQHEFDLCEAEFRALDPNRLKALENLTQLDSRSYFDRAAVERGPKDDGARDRVQQNLRRKGQKRAGKR